ncbi:uncharacterized protein LOC115626608 [Scaptodrosophila lebanonensis]|uniref:Uncharacterized protein LOC115626608 n=1 Tax=Drosophila lebanonensis TaxID=7225 RepID=A0A6J2TMP6_DROLE|nr:uncharacterized protein LOC115626608 [Scaptodrosophila lebanonensis]
MDLHEFLSLERQQLQYERKRLSAVKSSSNNNNNADAHSAETCPAALLMQTENFVPAQCQRVSSARSSNSECNELTSSLATATTSAANQQQPNPSTPRSYTIYATGASEAECAASVLSDELHLNLTGVHSEGVEVDGEEPQQEEAEKPLHKSAKDFVNQRELLVGSARNYKSPNVSPNKFEGGRPLSENRLPIRRGKGDDMEQWVTDTFYSYFPGFNNENQKRQNYLRERQRENQQNFLRHQMLNAPPDKNASKRPSNKPVKATLQQQITSRSGNSSTSTTTNTTHSTTDKTDLELIVNSNPNYVPPKTTTTYQQNRNRPGTTRQKLLQDLGHVELSNIVTGDGVMERNLRSAELETARKKDYQRDLMQQIEEKQRAVEILREDERRLDEALTKRLQIQLKNIKLEEQLEKERMKVEKARIDAEHNRFMREQLLAKLEKDAQLLNSKQRETKQEQASKQARTTQAEKNNTHNASNLNNNNSHTQNSNSNNNNLRSSPNKVYKYFSNSAHHEYRRGQPLPPAVELEFDIPAMKKIERECFHLCEKICPLCDEPLKSYESCCLRCQRKLALKMKQRRSPGGSGADESDEKREVAYEIAAENEQDEDEQHFCHSSYALVCLKCERLYALCTTCLAKSDVCRACQRERNVCMSCRRTLCSFCLEEVACGKDTERMHINELADGPQVQSQPQKAEKENAFRVLEVNYAVPDSPDVQATSFDQLSSENSPPYSINIARNSVFHANYKPTPVKQASFVEHLPIASGSANTSFELDSADEQAMERVRRQTDQRLSRYLKNYGDLANAKQRSKSESHHRGTQTTPDSIGRRDIVLLESDTQNLSMPLLREMPKMTRKDTTVMVSNSQRKIDNLKKRWEVPAVQKFTVSSTSPKTLTQVGAIRKQLQAERFFDDIEPEDEY